MDKLLLYLIILLLLSPQHALSILSLTIPSTIILIEFIVISTIAIDPLHDIPIILLGFLLLIPIGTLYVLVASTLKKKAVN
jgi:hypothetical protein